MWEYYMGWFHFDSTTELYAVPARDIYAEVASMVGSESLLASTVNHLQQQQPEKALHFLEIILAEYPTNQAALETRLSTLQFMLERAKADNGGNNYEKDYLHSRIAISLQALGDA